MDQDVAALLPHPHAEELAAPPRPTGRGLPLGRTARGELVEVPVEPDQGRHLVIFGETGMGKSSLLVSLAARAARQGGLVVLDPMGDTAEEIQRELAPDARRVLAIGPEGPAPALNALDGLHPDGTDPVDRERRIADLVHALRRVRSGRFTDAAFWGPRLEEFLTRAVRAAAAFPGGTLEDAHALLASDEARRRLGPPNARALLGELYARLRARPEDAEGARRLLDEVVRDPTLRRLLCARTPDLSTSELVKPGAVTVVSGAARRVGEATARYLLAVYLALIWSELIATSRTAKTFVFLDEAQWFAHESLAEMLRLARRRNVHVVLATQSAAALPESVRESVWTNAADVASFRGSPEEARDLERAVPGARADRLLSLDRGEAAVLIGKGASVHWIRTARSPRPVPGTVASAVPRASPLGSAVNGRSVEEICRWLGERATAARAVGPFPVRWAEIDPGFERPGARLREVGSRLGRWGAIVRTERGPAGPIWWLAPEVIVARTAPDPAPAAARSSPAQPS